MKHLLALFLFLGSIPVFSQDLNNHFRHLSSKDGLGSNNIKCFHKDSRGFLWIGTDEGLSRFDGTNVSTYHNVPNDPTSLVQNEIMDICEDAEGRIWVATKGGLCVLQHNNQFVQYRNLKSDTGEIQLKSGVNSIAYFKGNLYMGLNKGILIASPDLKKIIRISDFPFLQKSGKKIRCIPNAMFETRSGLWICTFTGMVLTDGKQFYHEGNNPKRIPILEHGFKPGFCDDNKGNIYYMTWNFPGVYMYNEIRNSTDSIKISEEVEISPISMVKLDNGKLWVSTMLKGIAEIDLKIGKYKLIQNDNDIPGSLSNNSINYLYKDELGTVFVTTGSGMDYAHPTMCNFNYVKTEVSDKSPFPTNAAYTLYKDVQNRIWAASFNTGLYQVDLKSGKTKRMALVDDEKSIWCVFEKDGKLLLATYAGLGYLDEKNNKFRPFELPSEMQDLIYNGTTFIQQDKAGNLWIGIWQAGLLKLEKDNKYQFFASTDKNAKLKFTTPEAGIIDENNDLWFGYLESNCITRIHLDNLNTQHFDLTTESLFSGAINGIEILGEDLWITTSHSGLIQMNRITKKTNYYNTSNVLPSNKMNFIHTDANHMLWIGSSKGLIQFDPKSKNANIFQFSDGLPTEKIDEADLIFQEANYALMTCDKYLMSFDPLHLILNPHLPKLQFTSIRKSGVEIPLYKGLQDIDLSYKDKSVTFEFSGINFIDPDKNIYQYKLEGLDKNWTNLGRQSSIQFTTLPPGDYTLLITCTNKPFSNQADMMKFNLHISGPFWKTWWFIAIVILLLMFAVYLVYRIRLQRFLQLQAIRDKISKDLHDDIGSALSSVAIYSEVAKNMSQQKMPELGTILDNLQSTAKGAMENMSDIVWAIHPKNDRFQNIVERLETFAIQLFSASGVHLKLDIPQDLSLKQLSIQQRKNVYLICKEALNNIAKYAEAEECRIRILSENKNIIIKIEDNGKGIDPEQKTMGGNGLLNMKKRAEELRGVLDIISEKHKGTSLILTFSL